MIVCHCLGLSHRDIQGAVRAGATTVAAVGRACGAATDCRGCAAVVRALVEEAKRDVPALIGEGLLA